MVVGPDGTKYKFGRHAFRYGKTLNMPTTYQFQSIGGSITEHTEVYLQRQNTVLLITEVEDIHGNYVRYEYTNNAQAELTRIYSDDAREITLHYKNESLFPLRNSRRISHIIAHDPNDVANERTWNYAYETDGGAALQKVTLPDGRYWQLGAANSGLSAMRYERHPYYLCLPYDFSMSIKHPDGATGTFRLVETRHIKSAYDSGDAFNDENHYLKPQVIPVATNDSVCWIGKPKPSSTTGREKLFERPQGWPIYHSMSVVEKTISGSNIPTATWGFDYRNYDGTTATGALDLSQTWTTVTEPDGTNRKYTYQTRGKEHGLLKKIEVSEASDSLESFEYEYDLSRVDYLNISQVACLGGGGGEFGDTTLSCFNFTKRPESRVIHKRYSDTNVTSFDTYTTEKSYNKITGSNKFTDYGYPNEITSYSTLQAGQRVIDVTYEHNVSANIIGLIKQVDRNGKEFAKYYYNAKGQKTRIDSMGLKRETYAYHPDGNVSSITDGLLKTATLTSYYRGIPRSIARRDGTSLARTVNDRGWVTSETDGNGNTTAYEYNDAGWMTRVNRPDSWSDTTITYTGLGTSNFYRTISRNTKRNVEYFDAMLRPWKVREYATYGGGASSYLMTEYDEMGRVISKSLPSASSTSYPKIRTSYDGLSRVKQVTEYFGSYVTTRTDYLTGNKVRVTDPLGNKTTTKRSGYGSPTDGQVTLIESPEGVNTSMTHDIYGNIKTLTQSGYGSTGQGYKTSTQYWTYDSRLNVCRQYVPETGSKLLKYDNNDQVIQYAEGASGTSGCLTSLPSSTRVTQTYDNVGRLKTINYPDYTPDVSLIYDANGNMIKNTRGGIIWDYEYDSLNNLIEEELRVDGRTYTAQYGYNSMGAMSSYQSPSGRNINYTPNGLGQPTRLYSTTNSKNYASSALYHVNGAIKSFNYGNSVKYQQDLNGRQLPSRVRSTYSSAKYVDLQYGYDKNSNTTSMTNYAVSGENRTMTYDDLGRLKTASGPWGSGSFEYDALGNILEKRLGSRTVSMNYDSQNRLSSYNDTGNGNNLRTYAYDARGNVTNNNLYSSSGIGFTYDLANQPVSLSKTSSGSFAYDGNFKRVKQTIDGKTIYSFYSISGKLLYRDNPSSSTDKSDYFSIDNVTAVRVKGSIASGSEEYLHPDLLGSAVAATNSSRTLQWRESHTPFGEKRNDPVQNKDDIGFTGHIEDSTGLTYMQARYYDPVIGRFYSNDPVGYTLQNPVMSFNRYMYVNNNPYKYNDPNGEFLNFAIGAIVGAVAEVAVQVAFEGRSFSNLDTGAIKQSAAIGALSGGVGGAAGKLAGKIITSATKPANAFGNGASKVLTGAASGSIGGAVGGATNSAATQLVETGTIDGGQVVDAATTGLVTGGLGGAASGQVRASATQATLGNARANPVFTSAQPGERAAAATSAAASALSSTAVKANNSCEQSGNC